MQDPTTERLTLETDGGTAHLSMRGKMITVVSCHSFALILPHSGRSVTLNSKTEVGSVSWPLLPKEAGQVWNELFKETPDARN